MTNEAFINIRPIIKIDGEPNDELQRALKAFVINLPLSGMAHGEITAINWMPTGDSAELGFGFQEVGLGKSIEILMGENNDIPIFSGEITAIEERYSNAAPNIILLVQDKLHILARLRQNRVFEDQSPNDIVNTIASELGLTADANIATATANYHQMNESNFSFLSRILNSFGTTFRIEGSVLRARAEEPDTEPVELNAENSSMNVRLIADLNHQPEKVTVKGFNADTAESVSQQSNALPTPPEGITAKDINQDLSWPGENIVPQPFPRSQTEAESFAKAHFSRMARRFVSGDIRCIGEPLLSSGREVNLRGVSSRFQGKYQVVHCTHCFSHEQGYETHLKVNRADGQR
jgi:uncharacterized protein involved in type VI secretion and phage assembly